MRTSDPHDGISREIDVMISDSEGELPWFAEGNLVIAPPSSVVAQIHVKTEFKTKELVDVFSSGAKNNRVFEASVTKKQLWFGGIFFSSTDAVSVPDLKNVWALAMKAAIKASLRPEELPDCIAILNGPAFLVEKSLPNRDKIIVRAYDCGGTSAAIFLSHLYESIPCSGKDLTRRGEWFQMIAQVCKGTLFTEAFSIPSK